jgi:hypothetical protein
VDIEAAQRHAGRRPYLPDWLRMGVTAVANMHRNIAPGRSAITGIDRAGWSPWAPSQAATLGAPPFSSLIVVLDHHQARIYYVDIDGDDPGGHLVTPYDPQHLHHNVSRKYGAPEHPDAAMGDHAYYDLIARASAAGGRIVVVGRDLGETSAAHQLALVLRRHSPGAYERIIREASVADIGALTRPDLLRIAREALKVG